MIAAQAGILLTCNVLNTLMIDCTFSRPPALARRCTRTHRWAQILPDTQDLTDKAVRLEALNMSPVLGDQTVL